jgi:integrase
VPRYCRCVLKIFFTKEAPARRGFLEQEKFDELVKLLPAHLRPLVLRLYCCGVRVGEALQITWSQVDLHMRLTSLEATPTKTDTARTVPLPSPLVAMLTKVEAKIGKVFSNTNLRTEWQKACATCGLGKRELATPKDGFAWYKYSGLLIHDLRRSAIRTPVNSGVNERVLMEFQGTRHAKGLTAIASSARMT